MLVMKMSYRVDGVQDRTFGLYVKDYNPYIDQDEAFLLTVVDDIRQARKFTSMEEATDYYRQVSPNVPVREWDGGINRPLTAWCIEIVPFDMINGVPT